MQITPWEKECQKCGWKWIARTTTPAQCPRCKTYKWNEKPTTMAAIE